MVFVKPTIKHRLEGLLSFEQSVQGLDLDLGRCLGQENSTMLIKEGFKEKTDLKKWLGGCGGWIGA